MIAGLALLTAHAADESGSPWETGAWLNVGTGYASESRVDPDLDLAAVPGGSFLNFTPSVGLRRPIGARSSFALSATASLEQLLDSEGRLVLGFAGTGDLTIRSSGAFYGRISFGGEYFDDSEIETAHRTGLGGSGAIGWGNSRRSLELILGARQRLYSDLLVEDDAGVLGSYDETTTSLGLALTARTGGSTLVRGEAALLSNDARDPLYDATAWYFRGDLRLAGRDRWTTWLSGTYQRREFDERAPGDDIDDYLALGVRLERSLRGNRSLGLQYAYAAYGEPEGDDDDTHRAVVFFTWRFGRASERVSPALRTSARGLDRDAIPEDGSVLFRISAPGAAAVAVVGDFNGWDPARGAMSKAADGWWEVQLTIEPGQYQYGFVIDGEHVPPPDPYATVEDGFGGLNGLLVVPE